MGTPEIPGVITVICAAPDECAWYLKPHFPAARFAKTPKHLVEILSTEGHKRAPVDIWVVHWHWKIPDDIIFENQVVGFHMTDLPWGRGPTPLKKIKYHGFSETIVTAFEMDNNIDGGTIVSKRSVPVLQDDEATMRLVYAACKSMIWVIQREGYPMYIPQWWYNTGEEV